MTEFLNFEVVLSLKDGTKTQGLVTQVDGSHISLGNKVIRNALVKDLKVVNLPRVNEESKKINNTLHIADSAILFSEPNSSNTTPRFRSNSQDWGSNVQEIKTSEEFDFAANLARFDKKSVFADFSKHDNVNIQDRLVGHNKSDITSKNAHHKYEIDEMVLKQEDKDNWDNISSLSQRFISPTTAGGLQLGSSTIIRESQKYQFTFEDSSDIVPLATPVQLMEIEKIASESFGIDENISIESCASNLYDLVVSKILGGSIRLSNRKNHNLPPLVLLLIGEGRCSSKAFAVGRHLTNHGMRVLAFVINEEIVESETLHQCQIFERSGGKVVSAAFPELLDILENQLDTPVELVIDSLQGYASQLPDLFYTAQSMETLKQVIRWANDLKRKFQVLSLEISAGIDGGSGTVLDSRMRINSHYIASLGIPVSGLIHSYTNGSLDECIQHYMVDIGICNAVYNTRPQLRKFHKLWFCAEGYVRLRLTKE